jgi:antirestriction protein ArdC
MSARVSEAGGGRRDLYGDVTRSILDDLEGGTFPWAQPWSAPAASRLPYNLATGRAYSGINILLFWTACARHGFARSGFLTFRQALSLGGRVRRGERGFRGVFAQKVVLAAERRLALAEGRAPVEVAILKPFTVFNLEQCEGLPAELCEPPPPVAEGLIAPRAEALIAATGADLRIGGGVAFYDPDGDVVQVPPPEAFAEPINWHRTAFHELGHWTGHASRLARDQAGAFGTAAYAREELVAELAGAFVCAALAIRPTVRHADYLASWLQVLRDDPRAIVRAASAASRAADLLLSYEPDGARDAAEGGA